MGKEYLTHFKKLIPNLNKSHQIFIFIANIKKWKTQRTEK